MTIIIYSPARLLWKCWHFGISLRYQKCLFPLRIIHCYSDIPEIKFRWVHLISFSLVEGQFGGKSIQHFQICNFNRIAGSIIKLNTNLVLIKLFLTWYLTFVVWECRFQGIRRYSEIICWIYKQYIRLDIPFLFIMHLKYNEYYLKTP